MAIAEPDIAPVDSTPKETEKTPKPIILEVLPYQVSYLQVQKHIESVLGGSIDANKNRFGNLLMAAHNYLDAKDLTTVEKLIHCNGDMGLISKHLRIMMEFLQSRYIFDGNIVMNTNIDVYSRKLSLREKALEEIGLLAWAYIGTRIDSNVLRYYLSTDQHQLGWSSIPLNLVSRSPVESLNKEEIRQREIRCATLMYLLGSTSHTPSHLQNYCQKEGNFNITYKNG